MKTTTYPLDQSALYKIVSKSRLAKLLDCPVSDLCLLLTGNNYQEFQLATNQLIDHALFHKKPRSIQNPNEKLKAVQRRILELLSRVEVPDYLFSATKGRTYIDNAKQHINTQVTFCADIKDFYQNTDSKKIKHFFIDTMNCSHDVAFILTKLICVEDALSQKTMLPTGGPLSPIMSFWANKEMFDELHGFALSHGLVMTVYVDDVTFSGDRISKQMQNKIKSIFAIHHYIAHKFKYYKAGAWKKITGGAIKNGLITAPNKLKAKARVAFREYCGNPHKRKQLSNVIQGLASSINQFEPSFASNMIISLKNKEPL